MNEPMKPGQLFRAYSREFEHYTVLFVRREDLIFGFFALTLERTLPSLSGHLLARKQAGSLILGMSHYPLDVYKYSKQGSI